MPEIITTREKWNSTLMEIETYDTYHTFDYHAISKKQNETPILLKYTEDEKIIALPLLLRSIEGTQYLDATSVYGYCGPISKGIDNNFDNTRFISIINSYFKKNKIISIFSRLNPYIQYQNDILLNLGKQCPVGKVVNINLKLNKTQQRQGYHRRLKNHVNKSRKNCSVIKANNEEDIISFIKIYNENMIRVNAKKNYFFSEDYFFNLINSKDFITEIYLAIENKSKKIIAGAMFFEKNNIVQYHLSGTKNDYLHLMPTKLLIDEMRLYATDNGFKIFNLGGGLAASGEDSLFKFKSSFSDDYYPFFLWKHIVDENAYNEVCKNKKLLNVDSSYFPLYRAKE